MTQEPEQSGQRATKLHHFLGQFEHSVLVDAEPGVVDEHPGSSVELLLDSHGRQAQVPAW
jgi:hypothetical protein